MFNPVEYPLILFLLSLVVLGAMSWVGGRFCKQADTAISGDFKIILGATLTILGILIGFCVSMAVSRYDQRNVLEEAEANAISTEYMRTGLLPAEDAEKLRELLITYLEQRILFYRTRSEEKQQRINANTTQLQNEMWATVMLSQNNVPQKPTTTLVVSGMNDVLNTESRTQASWWNRIPLQVWVLLAIIAFFCNVMIGYVVRKHKSGYVMLMIFPFVVSVSFFLIADIDSPRAGIIRVKPQNMKRLLKALLMPQTDIPSRTR